jgi:uncharacterized membrane protein
MNRVHRLAFIMKTLFLGKNEGKIFPLQNMIAYFIFLVPCIVIQLCNSKQQNALFKLLF